MAHKASLTSPTFHLAHKASLTSPTFHLAHKASLTSPTFHLANKASLTSPTFHLANKASLTSPHAIEMIVPVHERERSYTCVIGGAMLTLSTIFNIRFCNCSDSVIICVSFYYNVQCLIVGFSK